MADTDIGQSYIIAKTNLGTAAIGLKGGPDTSVQTIFIIPAIFEMGIKPQMQLVRAGRKITGAAPYISIAFIGAVKTPFDIPTFPETGGVMFDKNSAATAAGPNCTD